MIGDRLRGLFGQQDDDDDEDYDDKEDRLFSDVTAIQISDVQGYGYGRNFTSVIITEGYGPSAKKTTLYNIKSVYFVKGEHDWISLDSSRGTVMNMSSAKYVAAHYYAEDEQLRVGE